ncbi:MAG: hypothetical protein NDI94_05325, partial [Candidatus Woesearchaeota archaeon]|nr:hypothetical protein [Candidatus Woesearchaeota archaeon]
MLRFKELIFPRNYEHRRYMDDSIKNIGRYISRCKKDELRNDLPKLEMDYKTILEARTFTPLDSWILPGRIREFLLRYKILSLTENPMAFRKEN